MAGLAPSDSDTETSVHTEPSAGDAYRDAFEPYRVGAGNPVVQGFRQWWLKNPLNNLWTKKPNLWRTYQAEQAGLDPTEAVKSGANVKLEDIVQQGPTLQEALEQGGYELQPLPSDEAWFGEPDPAIYAPGTNDLTKEQLAQEVAKGNVCTMRQLKEHLLTASEEELQVWRKLFTAQAMRDEMFVSTPEGRVSVWDLLMYVRGNPELEALAARDLNLAVPAEGMTRQERIAMLAELAPWRLCANERRMVLPPEVGARLPWGLLAGGTWWSRRPSRWLKGLGGQRDFYYGMYVHEEAAQQLMGEQWGGRDPAQVLSDKAFYREALGLAPHMGMTLLAVASRLLPLDEVTRSWEQQVKQQIDRLQTNAAASSSQQQQQQQQQPKVFMSTSSGSLASGAGSDSGSGSTEEEPSSSGSSIEAVAAGAVKAAAAAAAAAAAGPPAAAPAPLQHISSGTSGKAAAAVQQPPAQQQQQQRLLQQATQPQQQLTQHAVQQKPQQRQPPAQQQQQQQHLQDGQQQQPLLQQQHPEQQLALRQPQPHPQQTGSTAGADAGAAAAGVAPGPEKAIEPRYAGLSQLVALFEPQRLSDQTLLLDRHGTSLREGATIMFSAHPSGALMVQAVSPGLVKEQQSYLLGSVFDPQLTRALMSMFMDPDLTMDPEFTAAAGTTLLAFVNGFRQGMSQPQPPVLPGSSPADGRRLLRHGKWSLPAVGSAPEQPTLMSGVRRAVVYQQIGAAFDAALRAAAAVEVPPDADLKDAGVQRRVLFERRYAAEQELKQQLSRLGLDTSDLSLQQLADTQQVPQDLLSLARPLA